MAAPNYTSDQIAGSLSVTKNPADSTTHQCSAGVRCPRCERRLYEVRCGGVSGEVTHLGS
jgi:hypothetical protein